MKNLAKMTSAAAGLVLIAAIGFFAWVHFSGQPTQPNPSLELVEPSAPPTPAIRGTPFTDTTGHYSMVVPEGWAVRDHTKGTQMIRADFTRGPIGCQVRLMSIAPQPLEDFFDAYLQSFADDMEKHWGGALERGAVRCGPLGTSQGCRASLTQHRKDGSAWWLGQYAWVRGSQAVVIQAGAPVAESSNSVHMFDTIAGSFSWNP